MIARAVDPTLPQNRQCAMPSRLWRTQQEGAGSRQPVLRRLHAILSTGDTSGTGHGCRFEPCSLSELTCQAP